MGEWGMNHDNRDECLIAWNKSVQQSLQGTKYRMFADDVAQEIVLTILIKEYQGQPVPSWPGQLPAEMRERAIRMAKKMSDVVLEPFEDRIQQTPPNHERHRKGKVALNKLKKIEAAFTKPLLDRMINHSGGGVMTQKSLAESVGVPYRTFKYKVQKLHR